MAETSYRKLTQDKSRQLASLISQAKKPAHALHNLEKDSKLIEQISILEDDCQDQDWSRYNVANVDNLIVTINQKLDQINGLSKKQAVLDLWENLKLLRGKNAVKTLLESEDTTLYFRPIQFDRDAPHNTSALSELLAKSRDTNSHRRLTYQEDRIQGQLDQLSKRQSEVNKEAKLKLSMITSKGDEQFSKITREATRSIVSLTTRFDDHIASLSSEFDAEKSRVFRELKEEITQHKEVMQEEAIKQFHEQTSSKADEIKKQVAELSKRVTEEVDEFVALNSELRKSLAYIASDKLADSSKRQANQERKTANWLRIFGVMWLLATIWYFIGDGFNVKEYLDAEGNPMYTMLIMRGFFVAFCSTPGFYMLRESARHRTDERRYNQKSIQLASIDGYFAEHAKEERTKAKNDLAKHYFNGDDHFVDTSSVDKTQSGYDRVFDAVLKNNKSK